MIAQRNEVVKIPAQFKARHIQCRQVQTLRLGRFRIGRAAGAFARRADRLDALMQQFDELGIELLFLPSYSPNLNLIERLWKFVKKKVLNSKYYADFGTFKAAIGGCIADAPRKYKEELDSLLTLRFQTFTKAQLMAA